MHGVKGQTKSKNRLNTCKIVGVEAKFVKDHDLVDLGEGLAPGRPVTIDSPAL